MVDMWESSSEEGGGPLALLDLSMIRKWRRFNVFFGLSRARECWLAKMT